MTSRRSLRQFLATFSLVFIVLNLGGLILSAILLWVWSDASREESRLTEMIATLKELRGTVYRQAKEPFDARFLGDRDARRQYGEFAERIETQLANMEARSVSADERAASRAVRRAYEGIAVRMASSFVSLEKGDDPRDLDTALEQREFRSFEIALGDAEVALARTRREQHRLAHRLATLLPWLLAVPLATSVVTLFWSRRYLARNIVEPLQALEGCIRALPSSPSMPVSSSCAAAEIQGVSEAFARMSAELDQSRKALVRAEKDAALASLVPVLAHNIRNPLASIRAAAQVSEAAVGDSDTRESLRAIVRTADRIEEWTRAMLSYLGPMQLQSKPCHLRLLCDTALELLRARLKQRSVHIERVGWDLLCLVVVDAILMEQAIHGLLTNALDASPPNGLLRLSIGMREDERYLIIEDEGPGLPLQPCASGATFGPTTKPFGTGLGIPFAQRVCELHGAALEFEGAKPTGTRVSIRFKNCVPA